MEKSCFVRYSTFSYIFDFSIFFFKILPTRYLLNHVSLTGVSDEPGPCHNESKLDPICAGPGLWPTRSLLNPVALERELSTGRVLYTTRYMQHWVCAGLGPCRTRSLSDPASTGEIEWCIILQNSKNFQNIKNFQDLEYHSKNSKSSEMS